MCDLTVSNGRFRAKRPMQLARFVWAWALLLGLGLAGAIAGCGSRDQQGQAGVDKSAYKLIVEQRKTAYRQTSQARQATTKDKFVSPRRVKNRGPSGS